jgi:hypothetical protein
MQATRQAATLAGAPVLSQRSKPGKDGGSLLGSREKGFTRRVAEDDTEAAGGEARLAGKQLTPSVGESGTSETVPVSSSGAFLQVRGMRLPGAR